MVVESSGESVDMGGAPSPAASPESLPGPPRRRRWVLASCLTIAVLVVAAIVAFTLVSANRAFDGAAADLSAADESAADADASLRAAADETTDAAERAGQILALATDDLVDAGTRTSFAEATTAALAATAEADALLGEPLETEPLGKQLLPWDLLAEADAMREDASALEERKADADATRRSVAESEQTMTTAAEAMFASAGPAAAALEAMNVSAVSLVVLDFRDASEAVAGQQGLGSGALTAFTAYAAAGGNLKQSQQSELAEKAGPLLTTRLEIEEYARSIAGGVVLDFDWAPLVNGLGGDRGLSGMATWNTARGGFSTITLSDSIAETWPSPDSRAIVTHEVGHSITSKCSALFDSTSGPANEEWATAWAISMGQTAEGNGVQAYGYPSQSMIDAASGCR
ncbi:hypothetical protein [Microbacterium pygmaeum]|uniref:Uncharacterized protein n=1 Tax=Microbacterium pygmaeum TaxID=370764 RepID=A0A1G7WXB3_9MICO|nr:hypothetical protein [Microbacterium pygmaeum]SDG76526.1 hypothetical protein SAMN04489810_1227 [Microbacterium pygmaeum]